MTFFSLLSTSLKPHNLQVPADRVARSSSGSHSRSLAMARPTTAGTADTSPGRPRHIATAGRVRSRAAPAAAAPQGRRAGTGATRKAETGRGCPRLLPPCLPRPGAHHHGGDDGQQRVAVGQQPVRCLRAAARPRAAFPRRSPRSRHGPVRSAAAGAVLPLALRGAGAARWPCGAEEGCSRKRCGTCPPVVEPPGAQRLKQQPRL